MSKLLYNLSVLLYYFLIWVASFFNQKARKFILGRKGLLKLLENDLQDNDRPIIWFHAASLGEFEQGRPVMEMTKQQFPSCAILLTFFSPSGYEVRKDYNGADFVFYLPLDTPTNAKKFLRIVKPKAAVFIKYEFWYNYIFQLYKEGILSISISSIFREKQFLFHPMGFFFRKMLRRVSHFFVQNNTSLSLLKSIGIDQVTLSGDTRFDRVLKIGSSIKPINEIEKFISQKTVFIVGSSWPIDVQFLSPILNPLIGDIKLVVAPHNIIETEIDQIESLFSGSKVRLSQLNDNNENSDLLIIDNIGMLSQIYQYADIAYIGGGFRGALHNTLEAAVYGVPILFGKHENNQKFHESIGLLQNGGAFEIANKEQLETVIRGLVSNENIRKERGEMNRKYVLENAGATEVISSYLEQNLEI